MEQSRATSVKQLIEGPSSPLHALLLRANYLAEADQALRAQLGPPLAQHCRLANVAGDTVIMHADSPAWSSRLRFQMPQVLDFLRARLSMSNLRSGRVRVSPSRTQSAAPSAPMRLSRDSAELIESVAATVSDKRLQEALLRLARHGR